MKNDFVNYQLDLLDAINTPLGRQLLDIQEDGRALAALPDQIHFSKGKQIKAYFYSNAFVAEKLLPIIHQMTLYRELAPAKALPIGRAQWYEQYRYLAGAGSRPTWQAPLYLATYQQNPAAGGGGRDYMNLGASWAAVRDAATADNTDSSSTVMAEKSGAQYRVFRTFTPFNTSTIGASSTITAGTEDYHRNDASTTFVNTDTTTLEIVVTTQASSSALALGDFSRLTFASKGSLAFSATSDTSYNAITVSDLTIINKSGNTLLGVICGRDLSNTAPTGTNSIGSGTLPRLTITYTPGAQGAFLLNFI